MDCLAAKRALVIKDMQEGKKINKKESKYVNEQMDNMAEDFEKLWLARNKASRLRDNLLLFKEAHLNGCSKKEYRDSRNNLSC